MEFEQKHTSCTNNNQSTIKCESVDSGTILSDMDVNGGPSSSTSKSPCLEILIQPQSKFRFRYKSEMTGKHGNLLGAEVPNSLHSARTYPTVKLHDFPDDAIIRCSIVCEPQPHYPHPHILDMANSSPAEHLPSSGEESEDVFENPPKSYVEIPVGSSNEHTAIFHGMNIIFTGRKNMKKELAHKFAQMEVNDPRKLTLEQINDLVLGINLNVVRLCFEAIIRNSDSSIHHICNPVFSMPIQHNKSIQTGDLRIVRIDKCTSSCVGDEEIFVLVEKVDKNNIQIKFFEENHKEQEIWKAYGKFSTLDVHHQYAIVFKTPPYRSIDIDTEVDVWIELERPSDGAKSGKIPFKYIPIQRLRKMPKRQPRLTQGPSSRHPFDPRDDTHHQASQSDNNTQSGGSSQPSGTENVAGSIRQGTLQKLPCDIAKMRATEESKGTKTHALNVALSVGESLHSWAETSDFTCVLEKLRHLLCLVNENGDNALHTAILNQQTEPFTRILSTISSSPDISNIINEPNLQSLTPLALAVLTNSEHFVRELISHGADLTIPNLDGDFPLHLAVKMNQINCLKHLVRASSILEAINCFSYSSMTPLHLAVSECSLDSINILCCAKANLAVQEGTYGRTPLHIAIEKSSFASALVLLKSAGDLDIANVQNYRGDTPLHCAASAELPTLCALLLYFGADPSIQNFIHINTEDEDEEASGPGHTVFDVVSNPEILKILNGTTGEWEKILKTYTNLNEYKEEREKLLSLESLHLDSGIDIRDLT